MGTTELNQTYDTDSYASDHLAEKSIYQDDTRIFHCAGYEYDTVKSIKHYSTEGPVLKLIVILESDTTAVIRVEPFTDHIVRFSIITDMASYNETSPMLVIKPQGGPGERVKESEKYIALAVGDKAIRFYRDPFTIDIIDSSGSRVFALESERIAGNYVCPPLGFRRSQSKAWPFLSWKIATTERFFGLGEKWNKVEKTSTRATIWASDTCGSNTTDMSYKSLPLLFSTAGWGMMLHSSYRSKWEVGTFSYTSAAVLSEDPNLDMFMFFGSSLKDQLFQYTALTGRPQMPPLWALGMWMSRCQYMNRTESDEVIDRLRKEEIPCDVIHLDPLWMQTHYYFKIGVDACDFVRNETGFPNLKGIFQEYRDKGFSTCLWINPYLPENTPIYNEASEKGYLLKSVNGGTARLEYGNPVGMVDFTNPEARTWWKGHLIELANDGAAVFKPDYGDRVPEDALFYNGRTGKEMHNLYLFLFSETAYQAIKEARGEGIVWRRAGYIGSQRYPGTWSGDTQVSWEGLRGCFRGGLSAGMSGEAFWASDIGGFCGDKPSEELYCRWAQFGLLSSLSRFHGTTPREPWHYGDTAVKVVKQYAQLRYSLMPYIAAAAHESCTTGVPVMRHLALEFPNEPNIESIDDQYMLGSDLLIAPVLVDGWRSRPVYLPTGSWSDMHTNKPFEGGRFVTAAAPLEHIPVFIRQGAVIPCYETAPQHLKGTAPGRIIINIATGISQRELIIKDREQAWTIKYVAEQGEGALSISGIQADVAINVIGNENWSIRVQGLDASVVHNQIIKIA